MLKCVCEKEYANPIFPVYCLCGRTYLDMATMQPAPQHCSHLKDEVCEIASEIAGIPCTTKEEVCHMCSSCPRPQRLNNFTLALAYANNPEIDTDHIRAVIDGESEGFGTRLANTLGLFFRDKPGCGCAGHRDILDVWTKGYILSNKEKVIDWLQNEASNRRLPFSRTLTRVLLDALLASEK
jgi:hypothetical protein